MSARGAAAGARTLPTVADLRALKGERQLTMLRLFTLEEAAAAEAAGIDIASVPPELLFDPAYRRAAPSIFSMTGLTHLEAGSADDYLRWAARELKAQDIELRHVKVADIAEVVKQLTDGRSNADLLWINGENFHALKAADKLYAAAEQVPNLAHVRDELNWQTDFPISSGAACPTMNYSALRGREN